MAEEFVFAPVVDAPIITLTELQREFEGRAYSGRIIMDCPEMCWVEFDRCKSRLVVSTSADEKKEVILITFEYVLSDGEEPGTVIPDALDALGFSSEPDAHYR